MIKLRTILNILALASLTGLSAFAEEKPNIILIVTDDQGYMDVGFNGGKDIPTPHIDRIANEGVRFDQGYVSFPVCGPSRAGFMTGRYQGRFGFTTNPTMNPAVKNAGLPVSEEMISEVVKKKGYSTKAIGKWHLGLQEKFKPKNRGFDEFFGFLSGGHQYMPDVLKYDTMDEIVKARVSWYYMRLLDNGKRVDIDQYLTDELSDRAVDYIERKKDEPFFLYLAYNAPHTPLQATEKYLKRFKHIKDDKRRTYAAMVSAVDDGVGNILNKLDDLGIADNTLIFFLSDNGGPIGKGPDNGLLRDGKGSLYEGGVRVPFAMRWPAKVKAGLDYKKPISSLDIMATIASQIKVPISKERPLDGVDLIPFVTGKNKAAPHKALFWQHLKKNTYAVRSGDMKLWSKKKKGKNSNQDAQVYNIADDVSEKKNIAAENPEVLKELTAIRDAWIAQMKGQAFPGLRTWRPWLDPETGKAWKAPKNKKNKKNRKNKKKKAVK